MASPTRTEPQQLSDPDREFAVQAIQEDLRRHTDELCSANPGLPAATRHGTRPGELSYRGTTLHVAVPRLKMRDGGKVVSVPRFKELRNNPQLLNELVDHRREASVPVVEEVAPSFDPRALTLHRDSLDRNWSVVGDELGKLISEDAKVIGAELRDVRDEGRLWQELAELRSQGDPFRRMERSDAAAIRTLERDKQTANARLNEAPRKDGKLSPEVKAWAKAKREEFAAREEQLQRRREERDFRPATRVVALERELYRRAAEPVRDELRARERQSGDVDFRGPLVTARRAYSVEDAKAVEAIAAGLAETVRGLPTREVKETRKNLAEQIRAELAAGKQVEPKTAGAWAAFAREGAIRAKAHEVLTERAAAQGQRALGQGAGIVVGG